jgi:hypothetical protein
MKMKNIRIPILMMLLVLMGACKSSFTAQDKAALVELEPQLQQRDFEFEARSVSPQNTQAVNNVVNGLLLRNGDNASRIDVNGDGYTMKITGDKVQMNLPFYGERRQGGGYNNDNGFNFTGDIKDWNITQEEGEKYVKVSFTTYDTTESMQVQLRVFSKEQAILHVTSSTRTFIKYTGNLNLNTE